MELAHGVGQAALAHLLDILHLSARRGDCVLQRGDQFVLVLFRHIRPDNKHQFISTIHCILQTCPKATSARRRNYVLPSSGLRLNRCIAAAGPSFTIMAAAAAASSRTGPNALHCALLIGASRYSFPSLTACSGATPIRIRTKSLVPIESMIDSTPLCPAELRFRWIRKVPNAKSSSSWITIKSASGLISSSSSSPRTETPLKFMNVSGFASTTGSSPIVALAVNARQFRFRTSTFRSSASWSIVKKPRLWGVHSYCGPGLPSPTISFTPLAQNSSPRIYMDDADQTKTEIRENPR